MESTPEPFGEIPFNSNQGIALASGEASFATNCPWIEVPSW